jgi:type IV pilus assembly protein PilB
MAQFDRKLSGILVKTGYMQEEQREGLLAAASQEGKSLSRYLIEKGLIKETDLIGAVSEDMNLPPIDIERLQLDSEALELVPEELARRYQIIPVAKIGRTLTLAVADPSDVLIRDEVSQATGCELMFVVTTDVAVMRTIEKVYGQSQEEVQSLVNELNMEDVELAGERDEVVDVAAEADQAESAPVIKLVNLLITEGVRLGASDIHIEPYEKKTRVRYRVDGACTESASPPKKMHNAVVSRIKIMSGMDIAERRIPQDGKFKLKLGEKEIDFRVSVLPLNHGEKVVMRILDTSRMGASLASLGFEEKALKDFAAAIKSAYGMVLVTGPTGSGKSTTLYSAIKEVICVEDNITTVEDPVEYSMEGVNQVQVNEKAGLTFSEALRSILRQDPDTVLIGEIRDLETAEIAVKAALTGHLVLSTLHTNDAPTTVTRLVDMGIDNFLVASCLVLVSAQRLARRVCKECRTPVTVSEKDMLAWGFTPEEAASKPTIYAAGRGCQACVNGYKGRKALLETLPVNEDIREIIVRKGSALDIKRRALEQGMLTLRRVGLLNVLRGETTLDEVFALTLGD